MESNSWLEVLRKSAPGLILVALSVGATAVFLAKTLPTRQLRTVAYVRSGDSVSTGHLRELVAAGSRDGVSVAEIVVFNDYACPQCQALHDTLSAVRDRTGHALRITLIQFPQSAIHPWAFRAAIAVECAARARNLHRADSALFARTDTTAQDWIEESSLTGLTGEAREHASSCMQRRETRPVVESQIRLARSMRIPGTPATVIGGRIWLGVLPGDTLAALLKSTGGSR